METQTCRRCHKFFNSAFGEKICPVCGKELEMILVHVKDYLRDYPGSVIDDVVAVFHHPLVTERQLKTWVKEGRLQFVNPVGSGVTCDSCRKPIGSGRFCDKCRNELYQGFQQIFSEQKAKEIEAIKPIIVGRSSNAPKMRFIGRK